MMGGSKLTGSGFRADNTGLQHQLGFKGVSIAFFEGLLSILFLPQLIV